MSAMVLPTPDLHPLAPPGPFELRPLSLADFDALRDLQERCFPGMLPWSQSNIEQQTRLFPEGQLCIDYGGTLVASSSSLIVRKDQIPLRHTWAQACDSGSIANHDDSGDSLYGIEIMVDKAFRGQKLSRVLYNARKALARRRNLARILIGGRIPGYHKHAHEMDVERFVRGVILGKLHDPVLLAQMANGFRVLGALPHYFTSDWESCGHAIYLEWKNPDYRALRPVEPRPTLPVSSRQ